MTVDTAATDASPPLRAPPALVRAAFLPPAEGASIEAQWRALYEASLERNPFFAPWMLLPALRHLATPAVSLLCVFDGHHGRDAPLLALTPVTVAQRRGRAPLRMIETWRHPHCFYGAPLIRRGAEGAALAALMAAPESHPARPMLTRLGGLDADGPAALAVLAAASRTGRSARLSGVYARARLDGGFAADDYIAGVVRKKKRKEFARLRNRLAERGGATFRSFAPGDDLARWRDDFLALEHAGWKGRQGTSFAATQQGALFFREALEGALAAGALDFHRLDMGTGEDSAPLAMIVNFIDGGDGYSFKIAYDENHARFSPGVMLELEMLKALEARDGLHFIDSCAAPRHPMIDSLWVGRRRIGALEIARPGLGGRALLAALGAAEGVAMRLRESRKGGGTVSGADDDL